MSQGSRAGGRSAGGVLVQILGAPLAVGLDALSFIGSGLLALRIRADERAARDLATPRGGMWREIAEGMRVLLRTPPIRAMTLASAIGSFGAAMQQTVFALYLTRVLGIGPVWFGLVLATLGAAAFGGTFLARPAEQRLGPGPALIAGSFVWAAGAVVLAGVTPQTGFVLGMLLLSQVAGGIGRSACNPVM